MARRERTTALPRPRRREQAAAGRRLLGIRWDLQTQQLLILGGALAMLLFVIGWFAYRQYDEHIGRPGSVVLTVGSEKFSLDYYTERLAKFARDNKGSTDTNLGLLEQSLLHKLEDEGLTVLLAKQKGVTATSKEINDAIAKEIGVASDANSLALFDQVYRSTLKSNNISDSSYRRLTTAFVADQKLTELFAKEAGDTGELVTVRAVVVNAKDTADEVAKRIQGGENMGGIAQTDSVDSSKGTDGLMAEQPLVLLPQAVQDAIKDKPAGAAIIGPIAVDQQFWVIRVEDRKANGTYTDEIKQQLGQKKLDDALKDMRSTTKIVQSLDASDISWAEAHAK